MNLTKILTLFIFLNGIIFLIATIYIYGINKDYREEIKTLKKENKKLKKNNFKNQKIEKNNCKIKENKENIIEENIKENIIEEKKWLIIGIPTVPRTGDPDYLLKTLNAIDKSITKEKEDPFFNKIKIVIINHKPKQHKIFNTAKEKYKKNKSFEFIERESLKMEKKESSKYTPEKVMRQTLDVIDLLKEVKYKSNYFLFMEDDFLLCSNGVKSIYHLISKVQNAK
jgi:hypothetical protein